MINSNKDLLSPNPSKLKIRIRVKQAIKIAVKNSGLSVDQIAEAINYLLPTQHTGTTIYNWMSTARLDYFPNVENLTALCLVTNSTAPLQVLVNPLSAKIIDAEKAHLLEILISKEAEMAEIKRQEEHWNAIKQIRDRYQGKEVIQ